MTEQVSLFNILFFYFAKELGSSSFVDKLIFSSISLLLKVPRLNPDRWEKWSAKVHVHGFVLITKVFSVIK